MAEVVCIALCMYGSAAQCGVVLQRYLLALPCKYGSAVCKAYFLPCTKNLGYTAAAVKGKSVCYPYTLAACIMHKAARKALHTACGVTPGQLHGKAALLPGSVRSSLCGGVCAALLLLGAVHQRHVVAGRTVDKDIVALRPQIGGIIQPCAKVAHHGAPVFIKDKRAAVVMCDTDEFYDMQTDAAEVHSRITDAAVAAERDRLHDALLANMNATRDLYRGYQWAARPWRKEKHPAWENDGYTRQRENEEYEQRQLDYDTGLPMAQAVRYKQRYDEKK